MRKQIVLVVEDNENERELYTLLLEMKGFKVKSVDTGQGALAELQRDPPDIILTDIAMPNMNGLDLVRQIKSRTELASIPIIVMTAFDDHYLKWAECMGATKTISKPFEPDDLFMTILKVLPESAGN